MNQESRKAGKELRDSAVTERIIASGKIVVELKAISALENIHFANGRSYLKAAGLDDGLILNFATSPLPIKRFSREPQRSFEPPDVLASFPVFPSHP